MVVFNRIMTFVLVLYAYLACVHAFLPSTPSSATASSRLHALHMSTHGDKQEPVLLRAARGEKTERVPVWMMRQAGRHMQVLYSPTLSHQNHTLYSFLVGIEPRFHLYC